MTTTQLVCTESPDGRHHWVEGLLDDGELTRECFYCATDAPENALLEEADELWKRDNDPR